ncbi:hypothetical protein RHGRI_038944 [Rhododendron griersonianum]|uniref:NAC-A/B domain-containing protein n=1 Tax=Rhododendron griersonianum TaxID=479676 RepID=A0AAV6HIQ1_9ERIC|nr:hypothetical protein RHGRI_038944 [Rhododendron griersonianum]
MGDPNQSFDPTSIPLTETIGKELFESALKIYESLLPAHIYRVSKDLRELNESAYIPHIISIGPLHCEKAHLQTPMQDVKKHYAYCLFSRVTEGININEDQKAEKKSEVLLECVEKMKHCVDRAKKYYAEELKLNDDDMVKMMLAEHAAAEIALNNLQTECPAKALASKVLMFDSDDDDDDNDKEDGGQGANESSKQSRSEKKSLKAMLKLGMKPVTGVSRVTIKRTKNVSHFLHMKSPNSETYVIFGEAKIEELRSQLQTQAAQQFRMLDMSAMAKSDISAIAGGAPADEEEEEVDETGVEPRDIDLSLLRVTQEEVQELTLVPSSNL